MLQNTAQENQSIIQYIVQKITRYIFRKNKNIPIALSRLVNTQSSPVPRLLAPGSKPE